MPHWVESAELNLGAIPGAGTYEWLVAQDELRWSRSLLKLYGLDSAPAAEADFSALVHPDDRVRVEAETASFMGSGATYAHEFRIVRPDGTVRLVHDTGVIERDLSGAVVALRGINVDVTEQRASEIRTAEALDHFRTLADLLPQLVWISDQAGRVHYFNSHIQKYAKAHNTGGAWDWQALIHREDLPGTLAAWKASSDRHQDYNASHRVKMADGSFRWHLTRAVRIPRSAREDVRWFGTSADVHQLRETEEQRQLLLSELTHRIKNIIALVQSIARLTFKADQPFDGQLSAFESRLQSMAGAHDILIQREWGKATLQEIVERGIRSSGIDISHFRIGGDDVFFSAEDVVLMSMAIHELCTNALKYGALSRPTGSVDVRWVRLNSDDTSFQLTWIERGGPVVQPSTHEGFGSLLIRHALRRQMNAVVSIQLPPDGLRCVIERGRQDADAATVR